MEIPQVTLDAFEGDELRARTFLEKYALRDIDNNVVENHPDQMWKRVASEIASVEENKSKDNWERAFYSILKDFIFVPGGRIMFGAGQPRNATLLNCYHIPITEDSLEGIFDWCYEAAKTYSYGGGVGVDISGLRPKGAPVNNCAITSTGAVSFMDLFSKVTGTIGQAGRRGALMITIDVSHPDIEDFISIKNDETRTSVRHANISIKVDDKFMQAVEYDREYELSFNGKYIKTVRARELWRKIIESAHKSAEPGVLFWDTTKQYSPSEYNGMGINCVNPCAEIPLDAYNNCCLGSINLTKFVKDPFTAEAKFDFESFKQVAFIATRFLDNVQTYNMQKHALSTQEQAASKSRRVGVGVTGLGDALVMLGIKYDSEDALEAVDCIFSDLKDATYGASNQLAFEKGSFPAFDVEKHLSMPFIQTLPDLLKKRIETIGLRNVVLMTVPPVGSGSILAGTSSGIEPIFALKYTRRSETLSKETYEVDHPLCQEYLKLNPGAQLPDTFVTAHNIKPEFRVRMQAVIQKHVDSAISSTVNLPEDITVEEVEKIYMSAWKHGLKGITVYREGSREGILITEKPEIAVLNDTIINDRPRVLEGKTYKVLTGHGNMYLTVNEFNGRPVEVFIHIGKSGLSTTADAEALGRMISLALRRETPIIDVINQLEDIGGNRPIFSNGTLVKSVPDAVSKVLRENYMKVRSEDVQEAYEVLEHSYLDVPDFCKQPQHCYARREGGCITCTYCEDSKCE